MKHGSPSFGETLSFGLGHDTGPSVGRARFRSWTRFS